MSRLVESEATFKAIRAKATRHALDNKTYGTRASFDLGRSVVSFAERCQIDRHLGTQSRH